MEHPLVVFSVMGVDLAIRAADVTGVSAVENHAPLPGAPSHIVGLVATGEHVVALVDLATFFDLSNESDQLDDDPMFKRTLYVKSGDYEAGLVCNRARGLVAIDEARLREPTVLQGSRLRPYLESEYEGDAVVGVIDLPALLQAAAVP